VRFASSTDACSSVFTSSVSFHSSSGLSTPQVTWSAGIGCAAIHFPSAYAKKSSQGFTPASVFAVLNDSSFGNSFGGAAGDSSWPNAPAPAKHNANNIAK
jgi:hypothetical protein